MQSIKQIVLGAAFGVALFSAPALAADTMQVPGLWKLVSFHTEDAATKEQRAFYGEQPIGFMKLETDGSLSAWMASGWPVEVPGSVWEDAAPSLRSQSAYRAVFYSGKYRLDDRRFLVQVERAQHDGIVGAASFDLTWNEGVTRKEEARRFYHETDPQEREVLVIATMPMPNPNGAGNMIVGRQTWVKVSDWEFGRPD